MRRAFRSWERGEPPEPMRPELQTLGRLMEAGGCAPAACREAATADPTAKSMVGWERHTCRSVEVSSGTGYMDKGNQARPTRPRNRAQRCSDAVNDDGGDGGDEEPGSVGPGSSVARPQDADEVTP